MTQITQFCLEGVSLTLNQLIAIDCGFPIIFCAVCLVKGYRHFISSNLM